MSINLNIALKKDYADYNKQLAAFEKEKVDRMLLHHTG